MLFTTALLKLNVESSLVRCVILCTDAESLHSIDQKQLDFIADPTDPNFDPIEKVTCFSSPITDSTILKLTLQEAYSIFLDPVEKNMIYQKKQPEGVRYLRFI